MLGVEENDEIIVGTSIYNDAEYETSSSDVFAITTGDVYIGIRPLEPTRLGHGPDVRVWQDGQELIVSVFNYEGPPKGFWEYRSLGGPFFRGNVKNGAVLRVADCGDYASLREFQAAFAETPLSDSLDGSLRTITFGDGEDTVKLTYDLRELR